MILETTQMLFTCYRWVYGERPKEKNNTNDKEWIKSCRSVLHREPYRMTHYNHGCNVWVRECLANYLWLVQLGIELCEEKQFRFPNNKQHVCLPMLLWLRDNPPPSELFDIDRVQSITVPYTAMGDVWETKVYIKDRPLLSVLKSYHRYYRAKEMVGIVYYRKVPSRRPIFLDIVDEIDWNTVVNLIPIIKRKDESEECCLNRLKELRIKTKR